MRAIGRERCNGMEVRQKSLGTLEPLTVVTREGACSRGLRIRWYTVGHAAVQVWISMQVDAGPSLCSPCDGRCCKQPSLHDFMVLGGSPYVGNSRFFRSEFWKRREVTCGKPRKAEWYRPSLVCQIHAAAEPLPCKVFSWRNLWRLLSWLMGCKLLGRALLECFPKTQRCHCSSAIFASWRSLLAVFPAPLPSTGWASVNSLRITTTPHLWRGQAVAAVGP